MKSNYEIFILTFIDLLPYKPTSCSCVHMNMDQPKIKFLYSFCLFHKSPMAIRYKSLDIEFIGTL